MDTFINKARPIRNYIFIPVLVHSISCGTGTPIDDSMTDGSYSEHYKSLAKIPMIATASGDSMSPVIKNGHRVLVDVGTMPKNGEMVAASVNGEFTIKVYRVESGLVFLEPINPEFKAYAIKETDEFNIKGAVVFLIDEE